MNLSSVTKYWPVALVVCALALGSAYRGGSLHNVPVPQVSFSRPQVHVVPVDPPKAVEASRVEVQTPVVPMPVPAVVAPAAPVAPPAPAPAPKPVHKRKPAPAAVVPVAPAKTWECNMFFGFGKCGPKAD